MRLVGVCLLLGASALSIKADNLALKGFPFKPENIRIEWSAAKTNATSLWIYKVVPQEFPATVVSNLMEIARFTAKDKRSEKDPSFKDKNALYFEDKEKTRRLGIYPSQGVIEYKNYRALAGMKEKIERVPSDEAALQLALEYLRKCGIDSSQLATKPPCDELLVYKQLGRRGRFDKSLGTNVVEIELRGVFFVRRIDRVNFVGIGNSGGFMISFGNQGKVEELRIIWRNLEPYKLAPIVAPETFIRWIREGKSVITEKEPLNIDWGKVGNLKITKLTPYYLGETASNAQQMVFPFADLEMNVKLPTTNLTFHVSSPIIDESN